MNNNNYISDDAPVIIEPVTNPAPSFVNDWDQQTIAQ